MEVAAREHPAHRDPPTAPRRSAPSVADVQYTMLVTIALVLLVVLVFMRRLLPTPRRSPSPCRCRSAARWPACGTSAILLDNFSLMALTISVGIRGGRCDRDDREHRAPPANAVSIRCAPH